MTSITVSTAISTGRVQLVNVRQRSLLVAKLRVYLVAALFTFIGVVALCRIAWLGLAASGRCSRLALELAAVAGLLALAGYAWQGRPDLPGHPVSAAPTP